MKGSQHHLQHDRSFARAAVLDSFEHHQPSGGRRQRALGAYRPVPLGREHALDRIGAQVIPMLGRNVVEGQQCIAMLD